MTTFNEHDHPRAAAGTFSDKAQSAAEIDLAAARNPGASPAFLAYVRESAARGVVIETSPVPLTVYDIHRDTATWEWERKLLMTAATGTRLTGGITGYRSVQPEDPHYKAHGVIVTDAAGIEHLVCSRADAAIEIADRIEKGEGGRVPAQRLRDATGLQESVFEILANSESGGGPEIYDIVKRLANGGTAKIADQISNDDRELASWFGSENLNRLSGRSVAGWETVAIELPDPDEAPY